MINMKHGILFLWIALMFLPLGAMAQTPTMTFDGNKLRIMVPSGSLQLQKDSITNEAIRNCIDWGGRDDCRFMASPDAFELKPEGLSTNDQVVVKGIFNGEPISINVEMRPIPKKVQPDVEPSSKSDSKIWIIIVVVIVLLAVALAFIIIQRKKKIKEKPIKYDPGVISIINDESVKYDRGLTHVKEHLNEYLTFDMDMVFTNSTINKVYFSTALIKNLYEFFNNSLETDGRTNETGCFIIGCWDFVEGNNNRYDISLEYMVEPGDDADFGEYSLHFGKKISINMASIIDDLAKKSKRDYLLTCWMHSHPGLGLFLSNHDLIVQKQLAYPDHKNRLLAIVIDTNTPDLKVGFFVPKADGSMNNKEEVKRWFSFEEIFRQGRELNRAHAETPKPAPQAATNSKQNIDLDPDYFNIALNSEMLHHIGFSAHAVNQIDTTLYSCATGVAGYLFGEENSHYMKVDNCLPYENEDITGCLIYDDNFDQAQLDKYGVDITNCKFFAICNSNDNLTIWVKNRDGVFEWGGEAVLTKMKEWIRRKRV